MTISCSNKLDRLASFVVPVYYVALGVVEHMSDTTCNKSDQ